MVTETQAPPIESTGHNIIVEKRVDIPRTTSVLSSVASMRRYELGSVVEAADAVQRRAFSHDLQWRQSLKEKLSSKVLLEYLNDEGFSWRDIARLAGVSVPAVQKWRRGAGLAPGNHATLAKIVALTEFLGDNGVLDITSWLEVPLKEGVSLNRMDMLAAGRYNLVMLSGANESLIGTEAILEEFDADWRTNFVDDNFETFVDAEGVVAMRPKAANR